MGFFGAVAVASATKNFRLSTYSVLGDIAYDIAYVAGGYTTPIWEYRHQPGYFNHYHSSDIVMDTVFTDFFKNKRYEYENKYI